MHGRRWCMARIHTRVFNTRVSAAADCRDGQRGLVLGVTRDSLDFNRSLRGLFYLLQKHRLRYTIKLPAVRGLVPLSFLSLSLSASLLGSLISLRSLVPAFLAPSFRFYQWFILLSTSRRVVVAAVVVIVSRSRPCPPPPPSPRRRRRRHRRRRRRRRRMASMTR